MHMTHGVGVGVGLGPSEDLSVHFRTLVCLLACQAQPATTTTTGALFVSQYHVMGNFLIVISCDGHFLIIISYDGNFSDHNII